MPSISLKMELPSEEELLKALMQSGGPDALRPAKVVVGAPYASSMEFGTMPARNKGPVQLRGFPGPDGTVVYREVSDTFWNIYTWATRHATKLDPYSFARIVYDKVVSEGLAPHPYVRPALYEFEERFPEILAQQKSVLGAAEVLAEMIKDNLNGGVTGAPLNDTGALRDSIEASYDDEGETEDYPDREIWNIPDGDIHGNSRGGSA